MTRKLFGTDGVRGVAGEFLTADLALRLGRAAAAVTPADVPPVLIVRDTREARFQELDLTGANVLLDCANGATYRVAPEIFRRLGATVSAIATEPDGRNINDGVGSTHVDGLVERVKSGGHDVGFAFDGDGDRLLAVRPQRVRRD